jgi:squalene synthase HpnD
MTSAQDIADQSPPPAQRAFGSSFYAGMRILPRAQREAMFEIYAFCRAVDDIADSDLPRLERQRQLLGWRADITAVYGGAPPPRLTRLAAVAQAFELDRADFLAVIDGMEMDAREDIRAPDFATLEVYCDRVACAVGRLSVRVFGMEPAPGKKLADALGRALQLTNILRDLDEDAEVGRLYLPREALQAAGISTVDPASVLKHPALGWACAVLVDRASEHFREAGRIMEQAPSRATRAPRLMGAVYKIILAELVARGFAPPRARVRVGKRRLLWIALTTVLR